MQEPRNCSSTNERLPKLSNYLVQEKKLEEAEEEELVKRDRPAVGCPLPASAKFWLLALSVCGQFLEPSIVFRRKVIPGDVGIYFLVLPCSISNR